MEDISFILKKKQFSCRQLTLTHVLLEALLRAGGGAIGLRERHNTIRALQMRLQSLLIGQLESLKELLRLLTEVAVESPITPKNTRDSGIFQSRSFSYTDSNSKNPNHILSGNRSGFCVCIVDSFLNGFHQNS